MQKAKKGIGLKFALNGLRLFFREPNGRIHLLAALAAITAGFFFSLENHEWLWIVLAITLVVTSEMLNSAIELLCDTLHPGLHPGIGKLKDIAAGAVLVAVAFALVVAGIIFVPRFIDLATG